MKKDVLFLIAGLLANVQSDSAGFETVWVRDVTAQFQDEKRALGDLDLPDHLTFHLSRELNDLTLHLRRNYDIDPNADIYVVETLKDGRSFLARTNGLEEIFFFGRDSWSYFSFITFPLNGVNIFDSKLDTAVAYYQDKDNGAYMTVKYVKRSNHQFERVINGNIRIGDCNYELRPMETEATSGHMSEFPNLIGKRYILLDEAKSEQENIVENKDIENASETKLEEELNVRLRRFIGQEKQNHFPPLDATLPRYVTYLQDRREKDKIRGLRQDYYIKVVVLIDFTVWNLFALRVLTADTSRKNAEVRQKIKEAYSQTINGVNFHYKTIVDPSLSISVILQNFVFFQDESSFPHVRSWVVIENGQKYINAHPYAGDLKGWVQKFGINIEPVFDHAMLFTMMELYKDVTSNHGISGVSPISGVCDEVEKVSLIQAGHYVRTVQTATHELGHNLGACHDGEECGKGCKADDLFIMSPRVQKFNESTPYSRNPWIFSDCSVESFKEKLISKQCVKNIGSFFNQNEWMQFMKKQPGHVFTPNEQCYIIFGPNTVHYGAVDKSICHKLKCKNLKTRKKRYKYVYAARGTECGTEKHCIEGRCVPK